MAKRMTDSNKWNDSWYSDLPMDMKLVWLYILDTCDHAGVWKVNMKLLRFQTGTDRPDDEIIHLLKERIYISGDKWFIPKFLTFQYKNFFTNNAPAVRSARELLMQHGIINETDKDFPTLTEPLPNPLVTLIEPLDNPSITLQDKDKDKDMDMDKAKAVDKDTDKDKNQDEYTYSDKAKGNTKNITERVLDILMDADSDDLQYKRAVDDWNELGGINGVAEIMEWNEIQKTNWKTKLDNVYHIKNI